MHLEMGRIDAPSRLYEGSALKRAERRGCVQEVALMTHVARHSTEHCGAAEEGRENRPYNVATLQQRRYRGDIWYVSRTCSPALANMSGSAGSRAYCRREHGRAREIALCD